MDCCIRPDKNKQNKPPPILNKAPIVLNDAPVQLKQKQEIGLRNSPQKMEQQIQPVQMQSGNVQPVNGIQSTNLQSGHLQSVNVGQPVHVVGPVNVVQPTNLQSGNLQSVNSIQPVHVVKPVNMVQPGSIHPQVLKSGNVSKFKTVKDGKGKDRKVRLKNIQKCKFDIQELDRQFKGTNKKWTDPDFNYETIRVRQHVATWKRPEQFIDSPDLLPSEVSPNDICQGSLNDCYFLSAVSALAQKPYRVIQLFKTLQYNPNGYYICKLTFNGIYQEVIVDDLFPVTKEQPTQVLYGQPARKKYIWVMVLEKCWAKFLHGYSNCNYGYTSEAFQTLTSAPTQAYLLRTYSSIDPGFEKMFQLLKRSDQKEYIMQVTRTVGSRQESRKAFEEDGLPMGHAYSLLGVFETTLKTGQQVKLLQVRNPWGNQDSKLLWNDNDPIWDKVYPQQKQRMQYRYNRSDNDGVFYIDWKDFTVKFDHLFSVCQINDQADYSYIRLMAQDRTPIYFQIQTDGQPDDVGIYFVQQMQQHFKQQYRYCGVSVVISKQILNEHHQKKLQLIGTFNYFNKAHDNYFTLPIRKAPKGQYLIRFYIWWPQMSKKTQPVVAGLYSSAKVSIREVTNQIDNDQFIQENCLSHAKQHQTKLVLSKDSQSWIARAILENTNIGYVLFHHGAKSKVDKYTIRFDQSANKPLYFLLDHRGEDAFDVNCDRGYEYVVVFAYTPKVEAAMDKDLYPTYNPGFQLPRPQVIPL